MSLFHYREGEEGEWNRTVDTDTNSTSFTVEDLNPFTIYLFKIEAKNLLGLSRPSLESYPTLTHREGENNQDLNSLGLVVDLLSGNRATEKISQVLFVRYHFFSLW